MSSAKPTAERKYLGWEDANIIEWKVKKEHEGRKNWKDRWQPWMREYNSWVSSGITRAMRKPSFQSVELLASQGKVNNIVNDISSTSNFDVSPVDKWNTKKEVFVDSRKCQCQYCQPCSWPVTTSGEVGWLGQHRHCQLEIYPNDFMKKPHLPGNQPKISSFLSSNL